MDINIRTLTDAETAIQNSGVFDFEWSGNANLEDLAEFIYRNYDHFSDDNCNHIVSAYLISVGEDPKEYF